MKGVDLLHKAGWLRWGRDWQRQLAHELDYNERTVRRWASGEWDIPDEVWPALRSALLQHSDDARNFAQTLPRGSTFRPDTTRRPGDVTRPSEWIPKTKREPK